MLYELTSLFKRLSDKDKVRLICRYILNLPTDKIAVIVKRKRTAIEMTYIKANNELSKINSHDELIAALQEIFKK